MLRRWMTALAMLAITAPSAAVAGDAEAGKASFVSPEVKAAFFPVHRGHKGRGATQCAFPLGA